MISAVHFSQATHVCGVKFEAKETYAGGLALGGLLLLVPFGRRKKNFCSPTCKKS